jgi:hypothetical protein
MEWVLMILAQNAIDDRWPMSPTPKPVPVEERVAPAPAPDKPNICAPGIRVDFFYRRDHKWHWRCDYDRRQ